MIEDNEVLEAYENITGLRVRDMNENEKQGILYSESDYPLGSKEVLGYKMAVDACGGIYNFELLPEFLRNHVDWTAVYDEIITKWTFTHGIYNNRYFVFWKDM